SLSMVASTPLPADVERILDEHVESTRMAPVFIAAAATYISRVTGTDDVVLSLPVSSRTTAAMRNSGGMVSNVVPLRVQVRPEGTVGELVASVQTELMGALRHQRYRHEDMRRDAGFDSTHRGFFGPAVNIMLFHSEVRFGGATGHLNVLSTGPVEDLAINIYQSVAGSETHVDFE